MAEEQKETEPAQESKKRSAGKFLVLVIITAAVSALVTALLVNRPWSTAPMPPIFWMASWVTCTTVGMRCFRVRYACWLRQGGDYKCFFL